MPTTTTSSQFCGPSAAGGGGWLARAHKKTGLTGHSQEQRAQARECSPARIRRARAHARKHNTLCERLRCVGAQTPPAAVSAAGGCFLVCVLSASGLAESPSRLSRESLKTSNRGVLSAATRRLAQNPGLRRVGRAGRPSCRRANVRGQWPMSNMRGRWPMS